ncbi:MAG: hypothetical protein ACI4FY_09490 [Acetatifactor sp.]
MRTMTWKKKVIGYPFWFVTVLIGLAGLFLLGDSFDSVFHCTRLFAIVPYVGVSLLAGVVTVLVWKCFPNLSLLDFERKHQKVYFLLALLLVGMGIFLRLQLVESAELSNSYIESAAILRGTGVPACTGGAEYLYTWFLHKVFFLFGNLPIAGIYAQLVLQLLSLCLVCMAIAHLSGSTAGVLSLALTMLPPAYCQGAVVLSPEALYFLVWALGFFVISRKKLWDLRGIWYAESIVILSIACALDGAGFLLFPIFLAVICASEEKKTWKRLLLESILGVLGVAVGFLICCLIGAYASRMSLGEFFTEYWMVLGQQVRMIPWTPGTLYDWIAGCVAVFGILLGVFGYFRDKEQEYLLPAAVPCLCYAVVSLFGGFGEAVSGELLPTALCLNLFGAGILTAFGKAENRKALVQTAHVSETSEEQKEEPGPVGTQEPVEELEQTKEELVTTPVAEMAEDPPKEEKQDEETQTPGALEVKFPEVELLESPLPLPKKHVKKAVDFAIDTPEDDDYDYPVAEDDDYDV